MKFELSMSFNFAWSLKLNLCVLNEQSRQHEIKIMNKFWTADSVLW